jgi:hypothetical protein
MTSVRCLIGRLDADGDHNRHTRCRGDAKHFGRPPQLSVKGIVTLGENQFCSIALSRAIGRGLTSQPAP